jgi:hypothetical protein
MRVVLDTNIVIDLLHFADPQTQSLQRGIATGKLRCFTDRDCFAELQRVSAYRQFGLDARAQAALLDRYRHFVIACEREPAEDYLLPRCRDGRRPEVPRPRRALPRRAADHARPATAAGRSPPPAGSLRDRHPGHCRRAAGRPLSAPPPVSHRYQRNVLAFGESLAADCRLPVTTCARICR